MRLLGANGSEAGARRVAALVGAVLACSLGAAVGTAWGQAPEVVAPAAEDDAPDCGSTADAAAGASEARIRIGVLSPISGGSRFVGTPHKESVELAHNELGGVIPVQLSDGTRRLVPVELIHRDYETDEDEAGELARELVACDEVVALIGPVNSGAVERVLKVVPEDVAVVSALATAPGLTQELHKPNFFRLIFHDATRMQQYASFIAEQGDAGKTLVLYDESTQYGRGLCSGFRQHYMGDATYRPWTDVTGECPNAEAAGENCGPCEAPAPSRTGPVDRAGRPLATTYYDRVKQQGAASVRAQAILGVGKLLAEQTAAEPEASHTADAKEEFRGVGAAVILGSTTGALPLADIIVDKLGDRVQLYLVGSSRKVIDEAPPGSITIGDPKIDPFRAETAEDGARWTRVLQTFEFVHHANRDDFIPTAFDAYQAVHEALEEVLANPNGGGGLEERLDVAKLRPRLVHAIRSRSFNSIESWRKVAFDSSGDLVTEPVAPIYQITRGAERADERTEHSWVDVAVDHNQRWLWGPVTVSLKAHSFARDSPVELFLMRRDGDGGEVIEQRRTVRFEGDASLQDFYLLGPGDYFVRLQGQYQPANPRFEVQNTGEYLLAFIVAVVVAVVVVWQQKKKQGFGHATGSVVEKAVATMVLLFVVVFLNRWIQIPFLTGSPRFTALVVGVLGGMAGPTMVTSLLASLAKRVPGTQQG